MKERVKFLKKRIPTIFLALKRKDTPLIAKFFALITLGYALSPIDLIPDFIPILGYLDDVIILPLLITLTIKFIPKRIIKECEKEIELSTNFELSKKWYYGIPILIFWTLIILIILKIFFRGILTNILPT